MSRIFMILLGCVFVASCGAETITPVDADLDSSEGDLSDDDGDSCPSGLKWDGELGQCTPCEPCYETTETGCFMGHLSGTCVNITCEKGCLTEEKTPEDRYGYCDPLPGRGCVFCDTRNEFGAFLDCDPLYPDGPPDDLPEGTSIIDDGSLMRGYLTENPPWQDRLNPGEIRLSEFWGAEAPIPIDLSNQYVVWRNRDYAYLFVYHIKTGFVQQVKPREAHHVRISTVDQDTVYAEYIHKDDEEPRVMVVDPITRIYRTLERASRNLTLVRHLNARDGKLVITDNNRIGLYFATDDKYLEIEKSYLNMFGYVSGDHVFWESTQDGGHAKMYTISTKQTQIISTPEQDPYENEGVVNGYGDYVVWSAQWEDNDGFDRFSHYIYKISTGERRKFNQSENVLAAMIDRDVVVWPQVSDKGGYRIRLYDIATDSYHWVTNTDKGGNQLQPVKFGRWLAYTDRSRFHDYTEQENYYGYSVMLLDLCMIDLFKDREMCAEP